MNGSRLFKPLLALLLALALLSPGAGTAEDPPRIALLIPGEGSRALSPISVSAELRPEPGGMTRIELLDRWGRPIARQLVRVEGSLTGDPPAAFAAQLPFEIPAEEEPALLALTLLDSFNRIIAIRSTHITLASSGDDQIEPYRSSEPWVEVTRPAPLEAFTGGKFTVSGTVTPPYAGPVTLELVTEDGREIGSAQLRIQAPGETFAFETTLYYAYIETVTDVRLVIRQAESEFNTTGIADSILIGVAP